MHHPRPRTKRAQVARHGPFPTAIAVLLALAGLAISPALLDFRLVAQDATRWPVDLDVIAKIREEGLQRSQLPNTLSYMTDVLGARLTNSDDMDRAQRWVVEQMKRIGLTNTALEPFMDYGVSWDNEYVSLHMLEPDYSPLVGYPIAHTPGTDGKQRLGAVIGNARTRQDLEKYRGRLRGMAVLSSPPPVIDQTRFARGTPRRTDEEMRPMYGHGFGMLFLAQAHGMERDSSKQNRIRAVLERDPAVERVNEVPTMHVGPEYVLANISLRFVGGLSGTELQQAIAELDRRIKKRCPTVKRIFIEAEHEADPSIGHDSPAVTD